MHSFVLQFCLPSQYNITICVATKIVTDLSVIFVINQNNICAIERNRERQKPEKNWFEAKYTTMHDHNSKMYSRLVSHGVCSNERWRVHDIIVILASHMRHNSLHCKKYRTECVPGKCWILKDVDCCFFYSFAFTVLFGAFQRRHNIKRVCERDIWYSVSDWCTWSPTGWCY